MNAEKKIWIFCHYAQQPPYNTMLRYHNWGKYLTDYGYSVTIVAASTVHNTDIDVIDKLHGVSEQEVEGIRYLYVRTPKYSGNGIRRVRNMLSYCLGLNGFLEIKDQPDCIIICEAYLMPFVRYVYKKQPIICDTVDLWPLSIVEYTSVSNRNPLIKLLYEVEKYTYIHSDALIFSMEGGAQYIKEMNYANKVNFDRVFHINMGCDLKEFDKNSNHINERNYDKNRFTITYCGSMRSANHIIQICKAAKILKDKKINQIQFKFYGNGPDELFAEDYCHKNGLANVYFLGRFKKNDLPNILFESDVNIMTYMETSVMKYGGSQSKLFDYLASGKPIINCGNWKYDLITRYNCGIGVKNQTSENIANAIQRLYELSDDEREEMGRKARKVAELYDQPRLVNQLINVIHAVINNKR